LKQLDDRLGELAKKFPQFGDAIKGMAQTTEDAMKRVHAAIEARSGIAFDLGRQLQLDPKHWRSIVDDALKEVSKLPPGLRKQARNSILAMADGLERNKDITKNAAGDVRKRVNDEFDQMTLRTLRRTAAMALGVSKNLSAMGGAVQAQMGSMGGFLNDFLKGLGVRAANFVLNPKKGANEAGQQLQGLVTTVGSFFDGGKATGRTGWVGNSGERGQDAGLYALGRGEAVLNWAHQRVINSMLPGQATINSVIERTRGYHAGGQGGAGFATGREGSAGGSLNNVHEGVRRAVEMILRRFPGLLVTSTTGGGHAANSYHYRGMAVDISGASEIMNAAARWIRSSMGKSLTEGIHNPGLSIKNGQQVPPGFWGGTVWGQHANHIHIAVAGALGRIADAITSRIPLKQFEGSGALPAVGNAILRRATTAANRFMRRQEGALSAPDGATIPSFSGPWVSVMSRIASSKHWNLGDWKSLVSGESGGRTNARNPSSGAYGLGQFLGSTLQAYAKYGATSSRGEDQIRAMAQYISDRYGNPSRAYHTWLSRNPHWYATGGMVPGGPGQPVPIVAHAGEWVLNKVQQSKVAQLAGLGVDKLRGMLGFTGGPASFAGGGEVAARMRAIRRGNYELDLLDPPRTVDDVAEEIGLAQEAIRRLGEVTKSGSRLSRFIQNVNKIAGENGLVDQMNAAIDRQTTRLENTITLAENGIRRITRNGIQRLTSRNPLANPVRIAEREAQNLNSIGQALRSTRGNVAGELGDVVNQISTLREGGVTQRERTRFQQLVGLRNRLTDTLNDLDTKYAQNRSDFYSKLQDAFTAQTERSLRRTNLSRAAADVIGRVGQILGRDDMTRRAGELQVSALRQQQKVIADRLAAANARAKNDPRWQQVADDLAGQLNSLTGDLIQQVHDNVSAGLDAINTEFDRQQSDIGLIQRISTALGNTGALKNLGQLTISAMQSQINALIPMLSNATATGDVGLANQITSQIQDLQARVVEGTAQMLRDAMEQVDKNFQRGTNWLDIANRGADLQERIGDRLGAVRSRVGVENNRLALLQGTRDQYQGLLRQAQQQGNLGAIDDLTDKLADLSQQIAEENQTRKELVYTYRQTASDIITGRSSRATGLIGSASSILEKLAQISGTPNPQQQVALVQEQQQVLAASAREIFANIGRAVFGNEFGQSGSGVLRQLSEAFNNSPGSFASALATLGPQIAALESTMGDTERNAFGALIQAMIDNTTQTVDNTEQIQTLNGTFNQPQQWSSSAWQWFREAIFTGMGDVLPQYNVPHLDTGGTITREGLFMLHAGEVVRPSGNSSDGDINITLNSIDGNVDLTALSSRIAFEKKSR
jgi:uncharacterized protein YutE (UPF0331/DUF86 family)